MKKEFLFKYRSIENIDRDLLMLAGDSFYAANIKNLNDDQECFLDGQVFVDSLQALLKIFPKSGTPIENVKIAFDNYVSCREKVGIFSLSKNPCVGMMWALYASMRHGYCIIYNKDALLKAPDRIYQNDRIMLEVKYSKKAPKADLRDISNGRLPQKLFGTKETGWSAEEEVRIVTDKFGMQSLVPSALHGIIFGSEMSDDNKKKIKDALKDKNVSFYQLQRKKDNYGYEYVFDDKNEVPSNLDETTYLAPMKEQCGVTDNFFVKLTVPPKSKNWLVDFLKNFKKKYADGRRQCNIWIFDKDTPKEQMNIQSEHFEDHLLAEWSIGIKEEELDSFVKF